MSYRLKPGESVPEGIKRIIVEETDDAVRRLTKDPRSQRDEAIHEARKSIKKIRGALRLVQPELGRIYRKENARLGDIGRKLSELRDAGAIIETFDGVLEKFKDNLQHNGMAGIRKGLEGSKLEIEKTLDGDKLAKDAARTLGAISRRSEKLPLKADGFSAIARGLESRYRRGRAAMTVVTKDPRPENYHEWRKRVKDHWYHVRLLESLWTNVMQAHEASLKDLETWLGEDHNLVVLRTKLEDEPDKYGGAQEVQLFLTLAGQYQKDLREKSHSLGERVYEEKPKRFTKNMSALWDAWQSQPDSMKEEQKEERQAAKKKPQPAAVKAKKKAVA